MTNPNYPLLQILEIKKKRVKDAEKVVQEKKRALKEEEEKLKAKRRERDAVKDHKRDKMNQLRDEMDHGTTSDKIQQMKRYLEVVEEKLEIEQKKVEDQKEQVKIAKKKVKMAEEALRERRSEVDKIKEHRTLWEKEAKLEEDAAIAKAMDEIGQIVHEKQRKK